MEKKKSRKVLIIGLILLLLIGIILTIILLTNKKEEKLNTPVITLNENVVTWLPVENASGYQLDIDGVIYNVNSTVLNQLIQENQSIKVKAVGDGKKYLDSEWSNIIKYEIITNKYTITWKNGDDILEVDEDVIEGNTPCYDGLTPSKPNDENFIYIFSGWSPEVTSATSDMTYSAVFTEVPNDFTIIWKNGETILETDEHLKYGDTPTYDGETPLKESSEQYDYIFTGWEPEINDVTESVTYSAVFKESLRKYIVSFFDEDGTTLLAQVECEYGKTAVYPNATPSKNPIEGFYYIFDSWKTEINGDTTDDLSNITGDRSVYAYYKEFIRTLTVYIVSNNTEYGTVSESTLHNIPYGTKIECQDNIVTIGEYSIEAITNENNAQYSYSFVEWSCSETVGNNTIITAVFNYTINKYTITWMNEEVELKVQENVLYGTIPSYEGEEPKKESTTEGKYIFKGWSPEISPVTGNQVYEAQFDFIFNQYTVTFYDENGVTVLGNVAVDYGTEAVYENEVPKKSPSVDLIYFFDKWVTEPNGLEEADLTSIKNDTKVYAHYDSIARGYEVRFLDWDGSLIDTQIVDYGQSATLPSNPIRENYRFKDWSGNYTSIVKDEQITATYVPQFTVQFVDKDNILEKEFIFDCGVKPVFNVPTADEIEGYQFNGWYETTTNRNIDIFNFNISLVGDVWIFKANYTKFHTVSFVDYDGNLIDQLLVPDGETIKESDLPNIPEREGYSSKWNINEITAIEILEDMTITANYSVLKFKVSFMIDNITTYEEYIEYGSFAILPKIELYKFDKTSMKLVGFSNWCYLNGDNVVSLEENNDTTGIYQNKLINIYENITIYPVYNTLVERPVIAINIKDTTVSMSLYVPNDIVLYSLNLSMSWTEDAGINSTKLFTYSDLNKNECNKSLCTVPNKDDWYTYNIKTKTFNFVWNCGNGHSLDNTETIITIDYEVPNASIVLDKNDFIFNNSTCIFGKINDDITNLEPLDVLIWFYE